MWTINTQNWRSHQTYNTIEYCPKKWQFQRKSLFSLSLSLSKSLNSKSNQNERWKFFLSKLQKLSVSHAEVSEDFARIVYYLKIQIILSKAFFTHTQNPETHFWSFVVNILTRMSTERKIKSRKTMTSSTGAGVGMCRMVASPWFQTPKVRFRKKKTRSFSLSRFHVFELASNS